MNTVLSAVLILGVVGALFAVVLYFVSQRFKVDESPLIDEIADVLPGANCGGCGQAGCRAMAEAFVRQGNMNGLRCPVGGDEVAQKVAQILGCDVVADDPKVAVVRCKACFGGKMQKNIYDGHRDCGYAAGLYAGETGCAYGCVGLGNCARACKFDAITMDPKTGAPVVDESRCTACGACVAACPRNIIELRYKGTLGRRVYVQCVNHEKGSEARLVCNDACIGCGLCQRTCPFSAITVEKNLAYIDYHICMACGKCVAQCPMGAITAVGLPVKTVKE